MKDRLIVLVSAIDLRREDAQINSRLSWEQCAEHTIAVLRDDPIARDLLRAAHVVVGFRSAGALWVEHGSEKAPSVHRLLFDPALLEGDFSQKYEGSAYGFQACVAAGIAHHLMKEEALAEAETSPARFPTTPLFDRLCLRASRPGLPRAGFFWSSAMALSTGPSPGSLFRRSGRRSPDRTADSCPSKSRPTPAFRALARGPSSARPKQLPQRSLRPPSHLPVWPN